MTAFVILLRRETWRYRGLFVASAAMGLFAALLPYLAKSGSDAVAERRGAIAVGIAALWSLLVATGLGATALSRGRGTRPLGFDLRLPAGTAAIWGGRLLAAYLAALGTGALVVAVALPFGVDLDLSAEAFDTALHAALPASLWFENVLAWSPLLLAAVLLATHVAELAIAGERALAAVDLVALLLAKGAVWLALRELLSSYALGGIRRLALGALAAAIVVLLGASLRQLARGRDDRRAAHRAATPVLVAGALVIAVGAHLYAHWYLHPGSTAVLARHSSTRSLALEGGWRAVSGPASGREHLEFLWLVDDSTPRSMLIDRGPIFWYDVDDQFQKAAEAPRVAWMSWRHRAGYRLFLLDLDHAAPQPIETVWTWDRSPAWRLAADGESVEVLAGDGSRRRLPLPPRNSDG